MHLLQVDNEYRMSSIMYATRMTSNPCPFTTTSHVLCHRTLLPYDSLPKSANVPCGLQACPVKVFFQGKADFVLLAALNVRKDSPVSWQFGRLTCSFETRWPTYVRNLFWLMGLLPLCGFWHRTNAKTGAFPAQKNCRDWVVNVPPAHKSCRQQDSVLRERTLNQKQLMSANVRGTVRPAFFRIGVVLHANAAVQFWFQISITDC